jgi:general secretion pathway protein D
MGLPVVPLRAGTRKGDKFYKQAQAAQIKKDWDQALQLYMQAVDEDPRDTGYLIGLQQARFQAAALHVDRGQKDRADGKLQEAIGEFQKAVIADPSSALALQELKRTQDMLRKPPATAEGRTLTPVEQIRNSNRRCGGFLRSSSTTSPHACCMKASARSPASPR